MILSESTRHLSGINYTYTVCLNVGSTLPARSFETCLILVLAVLKIGIGEALLLV